MDEDSGIRVLLDSIRSVPILCGFLPVEPCVRVERWFCEALVCVYWVWKIRTEVFVCSTGCSDVRSKFRVGTSDRFVVLCCSLFAIVSLR